MSDDEPFKVTDRRGHAESRPGSGASSASSAAPGGPSRAEPATAGDLPGSRSPASGSTLSGLLMMLTSSALVSLGAVPEPGGDRHRTDLPQAQLVIDVLLMLREKTQGNRTEPESRLLEDVLYDLQMQFVRAARAGSQQTTP